MRGVVPRALIDCGTLGQAGQGEAREAELREELEERFDQYDSMFDGEDIPLPPFWGGYTIRADKIEYWEGRPSRMHERVRLTRTGNHWGITRLYP